MNRPDKTLSFEGYLSILVGKTCGLRDQSKYVYKKLGRGVVPLLGDLEVIVNSLVNRLQIIVVIPSFLAALASDQRT